jgi:hypothetical protein
MDEALALLDRYASLTTSRNSFSAEEILDLTLDIRQALTRVPDTIEVPIPEPV